MPSDAIQQKENDNCVQNKSDLAKLWTTVVNKEAILAGDSDLLKLGYIPITLTNQIVDI